MFRIWLFGGVRFRVGDGDVVAPRGAPAQRLLAYLALTRGHATAKVQVGARLWGEGKAGESFRRALSDLRKAFTVAGEEPDRFIVSLGGRAGHLGTIALIDDAWVDALEFRAGIASDPAQALNLARGRFLGEMREPGPWLTDQRRQYVRMVADGYGRLAARAWADGEHAQAIIFAGLRREAAPADADATRTLMSMLAREGQPEAATELGERFIREAGADATRSEGVADLLQRIKRREVGPEPIATRRGSRGPGVHRTATTPGPRDARSISWRLAAGIAALAGFIVLAVLLLDDGGGGSSGSGCAPGLGEPDPADVAAIADGPPITAPARASREVDVGSRPAVTVAGREGIWVGEAQGITLINPRTEAQEGNLIQTRSGVYSIALSADRVWAVLRNGTVVSVDRDTRLLVGEPIDLGSDEGDVAVGAGSVWVNNYGSEALEGMITRIDPCNGSMRRIRVGRSAVTVRYGDGSVWVSDPVNGTVARVDASTERVETIPGFSDPEDLATAGNRVWAVQYAKQTVLAIDPAANRIVGQPIRVGPDPGGIAVGGGAVWLPLYGNGTVTRLPLGARRAEVGATRVGISPTDAAVGFGRVWVPNNGGDTVSVIGPG